MRSTKSEHDFYADAGQNVFFQILPYKLKGDQGIHFYISIFCKLICWTVQRFAGNVVTLAFTWISTVIIFWIISERIVIIKWNFNMIYNFKIRVIKCSELSWILHFFGHVVKSKDGTSMEAFYLDLINFDEIP